MPRQLRQASLLTAFLLGVCVAPDARAEEDIPPTPEAHYSVEALWGQSEVFRVSAQASQGPMANLESRTRQLDRGLAHYELGLDLVASVLEEQAWSGAKSLLTEWTAAFRRDHASAQQFINELGGSYSDLLGGATDDAAAAVAAERGLDELPECSSQGMMAMLQRTQCAGDDLTPALARQIDSDDALRAAVEVLSARPWPTLNFPTHAAASMGNGVQVDVSTLVAAIPAAAPILERVDEAFRTAAQQLEAGWATASEEEKTRLQTQLGLLEENRRTERRAVGALVLQRLTDKTGHPWSLCLVPEAFGGCSGENETSVAIEALESDRRLRRALERL